MIISKKLKEKMSKSSLNSFVFVLLWGPDPDFEQHRTRQQKHTMSPRLLMNLEPTTQHTASSQPSFLQQLFYWLLLGQYRLCAVILFLFLTHSLNLCVRVCVARCICAWCKKEGEIVYKAFKLKAHNKPHQKATEPFLTITDKFQTCVVSTVLYIF